MWILAPMTEPRNQTETGGEVAAAETEQRPIETERRSHRTYQELERLQLESLERAVRND